MAVSQRKSGVFFVNFELTSQLFSSVSIVDFEQVIISWFFFNFLGVLLLVMGKNWTKRNICCLEDVFS